jgi:CheY-like chemotaxis protein
MNAPATPIHVLLVEDNPLDARVAMRTIDAWSTPSTVTHLDDTPVALAYLQEPMNLAPDLVLLDLNLPSGTGHDVLSQIRQSERHAHVPVVVFTTSQADDDVRRSYELGANAFVSKPLDLAGWEQAFGTVESFWFGTATLPPNG